MVKNPKQVEGSNFFYRGLIKKIKKHFSLPNPMIKTKKKFLKNFDFGFFFFDLEKFLDFAQNLKNPKNHNFGRFWHISPFSWNLQILQRQKDFL